MTTVLEDPKLPIPYYQQYTAPTPPCGMMKIHLCRMQKRYTVISHAIRLHW